MKNLLGHNEDVKNIKKDMLFEFYEDFENQNSFLLFFLIIITLGLYLLKWFYVTNRKFEEVDEDAPDSQRAGLILIIMPMIWSSLTFVLLIKFEEVFILTRIMEYGGWLLIILFSLQYVYDFCQSFGRMTDTNGLLWYLLIYPGYFSIILLLFGVYYTIPLIFIPFLVVPVMQDLLNIKSGKVKKEMQRAHFNETAPKKAS